MLTTNAAEWVAARRERRAAPVRPTGMRPYVLLAGLVLLVSAAGCDSTPATPTGGRTTAVAPGTTPATAGPSGAATPSPGNGGSGTAPAPTPSGARPAGKPSSSPGTDPENPRDLAGAPVVVTGTISRAGGCVLLDAGGRRWALTGEPAGHFVDRQRVTVRGRPVAVPAGCDAAAALAVRAAPAR